MAVRSLRRLLALPARYRPWRPRHLRLVLRDVLAGNAAPERPDAEHLEGAIAWLCRAQDVRAESPDAGGVAAGWSFEDGWLPGYPETTGYIVETFLAAAAVLARPELTARAGRMLDWELSLQGPDGSFPGHFGEPGSHPVVFNTGQIMHGLNAGYERLGRADCLEAAARAGRWLVRHQDPDGAWRRHEHHGIPHVYNTRATWALARTGLLAGDAALVAAARRHLGWARARRTPSGWFAENAFTAGADPFTHTIAYAVRGFLECGLLLAADDLVGIARDAARALAAAQRADGWLAGTYRDAWTPGARYACLTGIAQMGCNWLRLAQIGAQITPGPDADGERFAASARRAIGFLKRRHRLGDPDPAVRGGVAGSAPIWGAYARFEYPNWAAKFFADALLMAMTGEPVPACAPVAWHHHGPETAGLGASHA